MCSYDSFPNKKVTFCTINVGERSDGLNLGIATSEGKRAAYTTNFYSPIFADYNLLSFSSLKTGKDTKELILEHPKKKLYQNDDYPFEMHKYKITIKVDYFKD
jgi:hypothetical protein